MSEQGGDVRGRLILELRRDRGHLVLETEGAEFINGWIDELRHPQTGEQVKCLVLPLALETPQEPDDE